MKVTKLYSTWEENSLQEAIRAKNKSLIQVENHIILIEYIANLYVINSQSLEIKSKRLPTKREVFDFIAYELAQKKVYFEWMLEFVQELKEEIEFEGTTDEELFDRYEQVDKREAERKAENDAYTKRYNPQKFAEQQVEEEKRREALKEKYLNGESEDIVWTDSFSEEEKRKEDVKEMSKLMHWAAREYNEIFWIKTPKELLEKKEFWWKNYDYLDDEDWNNFLELQKQKEEINLRNDISNEEKKRLLEPIEADLETYEEDYEFDEEPKKDWFFKKAWKATLKTAWNIGWWATKIWWKMLEPTPSSSRWPTEQKLGGWLDSFGSWVEKWLVDKFDIWNVIYKSLEGKNLPSWSSSYSVNKEWIADKMINWTKKHLHRTPYYTYKVVTGFWWFSKRVIMKTGKGIDWMTQEYRKWKK